MKILVIAVALAGAAALPLAALSARAAAPPRPAPPAHPPFDPTDVVTISGKVERVERTGPNERGVHLLVSTEQGEVTVHVGPAAYLEEQGVSFHPGDVVKVDGYPRTVEGSSFVVAKRIQTGGKVIVLRNDAGIPFWSGALRRR